MKESGHTNTPECCEACAQFYKNFVLTGIATVPKLNSKEYHDKENN